jgi:hypothetical protein
MQMKNDSGNGQGEQGIRYLLCDSSGRIEPELQGRESVCGPIQCLEKALDRKPATIVVHFREMPITERETFLELCAALKRSSRTGKTPVLALLHTKHRGLMDALERAGVDFARFIGETTLTSSLMIQIIDRLADDDRVERQLTILCPYLHYDAIDERREMTVCGAYLDRMVLEGSWLHGVCETGEHLRCPYYLKPRVKS